MSVVSTDISTKPKSIRSVRRKPPPSIADLDTSSSAATLVHPYAAVNNVLTREVSSVPTIHQPKPYALYADTTDVLSGYVRGLARVPEPFKDISKSHYRRRSDANSSLVNRDDIPSPISPISFGPRTSMDELTPSSTPPLIQDGSSDDHSTSDGHLSVLVNRSSETPSDKRQTRFLIPSKPSQSSLNNVTTSHSPSKTRRVSPSVIGRPLPLPPMSELPEKLQAPQSPRKAATGLASLRVASSILPDNPQQGFKTFDLIPAPDLAPTSHSDVGVSPRIKHPYAYVPEKTSHKPSSERHFLRKRNSSLSARTAPPSAASIWPSSERLQGRARSVSASTTIPRKFSSSNSEIYTNMPSSRSAVTLPRFSFLRRDGTIRSQRSLPGAIARSSISILSRDASVVQGEWALPTAVQLARASLITVISESGVRVPFGSLFAHQRTLVIFIRHFWCPMCQDYMTSVTSLVEPKALYCRDTLEPLNLVIIGNGSDTLISKYRQMFSTPFQVYTDPTLKLYEAMGMGNIEETASCNMSSCNMSSCNMSDISGMGDEKETEKKLSLEVGGYVKRGVFGGIAMVVLRAIRVGLPVWEKGGDIQQLGGEFVLGPGLKCTFAHRMQNPKGHAPILDVLDTARISGPLSPSHPSKQQLPTSLATSQSDTITSTRSQPATSENESFKPLSPPPRSPKRKLQLVSRNTISETLADGSGPAPNSLEETPNKASRDAKTEDIFWKEARDKHLNLIREKRAMRRGGGSVTETDISLVASAGSDSTEVTKEAITSVVDGMVLPQGTPSEVRSLFSEREDGDDLIVLFEDRRSAVESVYAYAY